MDGHGDTTLTVTSASDPATVLLDYGVEVEGTPYLDIASRTGTSPAVSLAFTETKTYLRTPGSSTLAAAAAGATTISVQPGTSRSPLTFAAGDTLTVGSPAETDRIVSVSGAAITLKTTPGTLVLHAAGLQFGGGYLATAADYQGYFLSSSKAFNTMFSDGAYTEQTNMQPAGTSGATQPSVLAFVQLPDGRHVTVPGGPNGATRTFTG